MSNKSECIKEYLEYLQYQKNYSFHTVTNYSKDIYEYFDYLNKEGLLFNKVTYDDLRFYLMYLKDEKKDVNSSIDRKLSSLRGFYKYLANERVISSNPFSLVHGLKKDKKLPRYFEYNELEELFLVPDCSTPLGQRDLVLLEMLYATGVRVSELVNIRVSDIDIEQMRILILGKGNKERIVKYGQYCSDALNNYLHDGYISLNVGESDYLFLNKNGDALTERGVRYILSKIIKETSIQKNISPHMIRHSFATHI